MSKIVFLVFIVFFSNLTFAQNSDNHIEWKLYKEVSGLQIFSNNLDCNDNQNGIHNRFVNFQFNNTTTETINISWQYEFWYNEKCTTCDKPASSENTFKITLTPGESVEGDCNNTYSSGLKIFSSFINTVRGSKLTKFEFKNLEVTFK